MEKWENEKVRCCLKQEKEKKRVRQLGQMLFKMRKWECRIHRYVDAFLQWWLTLQQNFIAFLFALGPAFGSPFDSQDYKVIDNFWKVLALINLASYGSRPSADHLAGFSEFRTRARQPGQLFQMKSFKWIFRRPNWGGGSRISFKTLVPSFAMRVSIRGNWAAMWRTAGSRSARSKIKFCSAKIVRRALKTAC